MPVPADVAILTELSFLELLKNADPVVQAVMAVLAIASVACWAIALEKLFRLVAFSSAIRTVEDSSLSPADAATSAWLRARLIDVAAAEPAEVGESRLKYRSRLENALQTEGGIEIRRLQSGLAFLATVGSTAPFIGLFGTVWGIMRSFTSIANAKDTSLAVVAPGIAEALFATAVGLIAAIPAVIFYNHINGAIGRSADRLASGIEKFAKLYAAQHRESDPVRIPGPGLTQKALTNGGMDAR